jgi:hypothetical protein
MEIKIKSIHIIERERAKSKSPSMRAARRAHSFLFCFFAQRPARGETYMRDLWHCPGRSSRSTEWLRVARRGLGGVPTRQPDTTC